MDRQRNQKVSGIHTEEINLSHFDTFLFDLDGTLIDSSEDIYRAVLYTLEKLGYKTLPKEDVIKHVGYGGKRLLQGVLETDDEELLKKAVNIFREFYFSNPAVYTVLYPGVDELLKKLKEKGKKVAVVTNKYEDISWEIIKKLEIEDFIDFLVGGDTTKEKKPSPEPVLHAIKRLKGNKAIIIGDSETDILAGKKANIGTCLVLYGFGKKDIALDHNPDFVIDTIKRIIL